MTASPEFSDPLQEPSATSRALPASRWQRVVYRLRSQRPEVSTELALLAVCLYFTLFCNTQFWRDLLRDWHWGPAMVGYTLAAGCALTALHFLLLAPWMSRWSSKLLLSVLVLVATGANYYSAKFHVYYDPSMLRNMLQTDVKEASELLSVGMLVEMVLLAAPGLLLLNCVRLQRRPLLRTVVRRVVWWVAALLVLVLALGSIFKDFSSHMRNNKEVRYLITPAALGWSLAMVLGTDAKDANAPRQPVATDAYLGPSWKASAKPVVMVVIVGETARARNWGLNRATIPTARDTTPQLAQRDVINFAEMRSCGTNTAVSLPCMFSIQGRRNYSEAQINGSESLLHVLQRVGLRVVWNENQSGCKGVCDGLETLRPMREQWPALCAGEHCMDMALLESTKSLMQDANGNLVLFLHQMGNHGPAYFKRHPADFTYFTPTCDTEDLSRCTQEQVANSYDNALRYTDHLVASSIDFLQQLENRYDTALVYVSDHGESLGEKGVYLHGLPYAIAPKEQTHIPMVMWFSKGFAQRQQLDTQCLRQRAQQPADHDHLFHTLLGLLDVRTQALERQLDLSADCRTPLSAP